MVSIVLVFWVFCICIDLGFGPFGLQEQKQNLTVLLLSLVNNLILNGERFKLAFLCRTNRNNVNFACIHIVSFLKFQCVLLKDGICEIFMYQFCQCDQPMAWSLYVYVVPT